MGCELNDEPNEASRARKTSARPAESGCGMGATGGLLGPSITEFVEFSETRLFGVAEIVLRDANLRVFKLGEYIEYELQLREGFVRIGERENGL